MKALVTGGYGFLGKKLTEILIDKGLDVTTVDLKYYEPRDRHKSVQCDLTDIEQVKEVMSKKYDVVYHLAGQPAVWFANKHPIKDFRMNVLTTINLLECCRNKDIHFVFSSSCAVYDEGVVDEKSPLKPDNFYAKSKHYCEQLIEEYGKRFGQKASIARFSFIYGPGMERNVIFDIKEGMKKGEVKLFISAESELDFIHIDDAVKGLTAISKYEGTYNISAGKGTKVSEIAEMMLKGDIPIKYGDRTQKVILKNDLIKRLGWKPEISLRKGLLTI